ncbi:MAG TPA: hypothetical protein PLH80_11450 [Spirochaetota bacterium]|nr:hypothetical protein [Spirochaetota bacterium]HOF14170.1 hypothetical protein [Spirochaetota bacterium]HOM88919.1 hypothetical protein [Spirochaetota bacterium]HOR95095.1 hypothetical protein [Spirochaetota bacterium]HOT20473.1 hypothetical protein [Spirochaetota bacterium]
MKRLVFFFIIATVIFASHSGFAANTISEVPIRIFFELVPALRIAPDVDFGIRGGLGARYFF